MARAAYTIAQTASGGSPYIKPYEAAGTITVGAFVVLGAGGTITVAADDAALVLGLAMGAGVSGDTEVPVCVATDDIVFSGNVSNGAPLATLDIGTSFALDIAGIDLADETVAIAHVHGLDRTDTTIADGDRVLFSITPAGQSGGLGQAII